VAWAVSTKLDSFDSNSGLEWDLPSITLDGGALLVLFLGASDAGGATQAVEPTLAGLTFSNEKSLIAGAAGLTAWVAEVPSGGVSGQINVAVPDGITQHESLHYKAVQVTGQSATPVVRTGGTSGSGVLDRTPTLDGATPSATDALSLAAAYIQSNQTISTDGTPIGVSQGDATPARSMHAAYVEGVDDEIVFSWPVATNARALILELQAGDDRNAQVGWAEMETENPPERAYVSFVEMEVPDPSSPATEQWEQSQLDGGGGINAVARSEDGTFLLAGGDISGIKRSTDGGRTWENCMRGLPDGGQPKTIGGMAIRRGSNTDAIVGTSYGLYYTTDAGDTWDPCEDDSALDFGEGGGGRPRTNCGHVVDSGTNYAYAITAAGIVSRFRWSNQVLTKNLVPALSGAGESIRVHPSNETVVYVGSRNQSGRITSAEADASYQNFTGALAPGGIYDMDVSEHNGQVYLVATHPSKGVRRMIGGDLNGTWEQIMLAAQEGRNWQTVAVEGTATGLLIAAICQNGPQIEANHYAHYWYTENGQAPNPAWTPVINWVNEQGGPGGDPWWSMLGLGNGGKAPMGSNTPARDSNHSGEDACWFLRDGTYWLLVGGQQGCFIVDRAVDLLYPAHKRLGVTANNHIEADPNKAGRLVVGNTDHIALMTDDYGETWITIEDGIDTGAQHEAGHDFVFDGGSATSALIVAAGDRAANAAGGLWFSPDPSVLGDWTEFVTVGGNVPTGVEVFRAPNPLEGGSPTRRFFFSAWRTAGLRRHVVSTGNNPTLIATTIIHATVGDSWPGAERTEITWFDNDTVLVWDFAKGIYIIKNARAASPTIWQAWNITHSETQGGGWIERVDADRAIVTVPVGASRGVYLLDGIETATNGDQFGSELGRTAVARPGGGAWNRPGPVSISNGRAVLVDMKDKTDPPGDTKVWRSETSPFTAGYTEISDAISYRLAHGTDGAAINLDGNVFMSGGGPGVWAYRLLGGEAGDSDRIAQVAWAEMEATLPPRGAEVSFAELQLPDGARVLDLSFAEMEIPEYARVAQVSWAELETPGFNADVSWAVLEIPFPPRSVEVSHAEMEIPDGFTPQPEAAQYVGMSGRILVPIRWRINNPFRRR
jgi:hypothetical protein